MDKISVIIPTYNRANLVKRSIISVLNQSYSNFEIIVIDDGSSDNTEFAIKNLADDRIIYKKISHSGVSHARNVGIEVAKGNFIAFLDSDDEWINTKLEKQMNYLYSYPIYQVCHTDEIWIKNGIRINQGKKHKKYPGDFFIPSLKFCLISPSSILLKREIFNSIGYFDESFEYVEDYELWLRLTSQFRVGYLDEKLVRKYGGHPDQLSKKIIGIEKYRMNAIEKFILTNYKNSTLKFHVLQAFEEYKNKYKIYFTGCLKRKKFNELKRLRDKYQNLSLLIKQVANNKDQFLLENILDNNKVKEVL